MTRGRVTIFVLAAILCAAFPRGVAAQPLPDGLVSRASGIEAELIEPTTRYAHGVLGDAIEAGGFAATIGGRRHVYRLAQDAVFEDRRVRLVDLDGDGRPEALIVKSYLARGAALSVFDLGPEGIRPRAESPAIGTANRWLNPVGVGRFDGDAPLVAAVITPHLAGSLRFYRLNGGALVEVARLDGFTNHIIGSRDLDLGHVMDLDGRGTVVLPTLDRRALAVVSLAGGQARARIVTKVASRIVGVRPGATGRVMLQLEDGSSRNVALRPE